MSSHSSPHVRLGVRLHHRAQSEPATPARGSVKNVLFAGEESLSTVRVFNASGKPVNGSERQAAVPVYAADCAPPAIRGALIMMWQVRTVGKCMRTQCTNLTSWDNLDVDGFRYHVGLRL